MRTWVLVALLGMGQFDPSLARPAVPRDAVTAILELFGTYSVVALGEGLDSSTGKRFRTGHCGVWWEDTTVPGTVWDKPMYFELFVAIRELNRARQPERRLRIPLGDPLIDWDTIRSVDQLNAYFPRRSAHAAAVIEREVLVKKRRALVIYGDGHLQVPSLALVASTRIGAATVRIVLFAAGGAGLEHSKV